MDFGELIRSTGCVFWKQGVMAVRTPPDKYMAYKVHPQDGAGPVKIGGTNSLGYKGSIAHVAIGNRLYYLPRSR